MKSHQMFSAVSHILPKIYQHPFNAQLAQGSLPKEIFKQYMRQDILYLADFSKALQLTANRLKNKEQATMLNTIKTTTVQDEFSVNSNYLNGGSLSFFSIPPLPTHKSSVIDHYTKHLLSAASEASPEVALSCILPCFYIYRNLGLQMRSFAHPTHPYRKWIESCSSPKYIASTQAMMSITEEHYAAASEAVQKQMIDSFKKSTGLELDFFEECFSGKLSACNMDSQRVKSTMSL